jgi:hypothetical protein
MSHAVGIAGDETPEGECVFLAQYEDEVDFFVRISAPITSPSTSGR